MTEDRIATLEGYERIVKDMQERGFNTYMSVKDFLQKHEELEKENEQLRADYDKQKEINKELVDDIADLHKRIRELETQIKQINEREAQDIRARFPC